MWIKIFSTYGSGRGISLTLATINDSSFTMANLTESVFSEFYQMTVSKTLGISASLITIVFVPMMIYCIYWYGKNCSKRERTLINNLAFSSSLCGVAYSVLQSPLELYITCFQPVPPILSAVAIILRNSLTGHFLTLLGVISLVRYVYIFIHKCPAGAHDNFWWLFINAATLQLQLVFNIAHFLLPGRHFILFYVWTNTLPQKNDMHKVHIFLIVCFILSLSICIFVELRVKILRLKDTQTLFLRYLIFYLQFTKIFPINFSFFVATGKPLSSE